MSKTNALWMDEYDNACEAFKLGTIDRAEFVRRLQALGLDDDDIQDHVDHMDSN